MPKLRPHHDRIRALLAATPDMTLAELRAELKVAVALSTVMGGRPGARADVQKKSPGPPSRTAPTCGPPGTPGGRSTAPALDPNRVVFVDETGGEHHDGPAVRVRPAG